VIIPFRPLQHMYTVEDQVAALQTAAFHLESGGSLVFDVFYPKYDSLNSKIGEELLELEWTPKSDPSKVIRRLYQKRVGRQDQSELCRNFHIPQPIRAKGSSRKKPSR